MRQREVAWTRVADAEHCVARGPLDYEEDIVVAREKREMDHITIKRGGHHSKSESPT
jgi:hypothetical protein